MLPLEKNVLLSGDRLVLRPLSHSDANGKYLSWMNDSEINQYLESRFTSQTKESLKSFMDAMNQSPDNLFLAITERDSGEHIGNIRLGPVNPVHKYAEIGLLIGEKSVWGKGYAAEAIRLISDYAIQKVGLHKVLAGCYANNPGSQKAFEKAGFHVEAIRRAHFLCDGQWVDYIQMARFNGAFI